MNHDRRVLLSVASAAVLSLVALVLNRLLSSGVEGGWFMYAPDSAPPGLAGRSGDDEVLRGAAVWLVAIGLPSVGATREPGSGSVSFGNVMGFM